MTLIEAPDKALHKAAGRDFSISAGAMRRIPLASAVRRARDGQKSDNQQYNADVYRRIGEVEDKKVAAKGVQIEIINDSAMNNAVNRVAKGAPDDQSEPGGGQPGSGSREPPREQGGCRQREREQDRLR